MNFAKELLRLPKLLKESAKEIHRVLSITGTAMLATLNIVVGTTLTIPITPMLKIGFSSLFAAVSGMYYGPIMTGVAGVITDNLKFMLRPNGPYFLGFTINEFLIGMIYGCFFYKKKITLLRVILARLCITVFINLILTSLWLNMMYQNPLFTMARLIKNVLMFPIDVALLYFMLKAAQRIKKFEVVNE